MVGGLTELLRVAAVAKKRGKRVVTLIPDASERYMSKGIYTKWAVG